MDHGLDIENRVRDDLLRLAKDLQIPMLATNDSHYVMREDAPSQEHLLCINSGSTMDIPAGDGPGQRFAFSGDGYYIKSPEEMRALWADKYDLREACDNTLLIAERCDVSFTEGNGTFMPRFPCPPGENEDSWLVKEVEKGLRFRYPNGIPDEVRKQADFEVGVITQMGFPGYFLVVADFINWAKDNGIRVGPGRGSGAGSMVAYAMRITDLDPLVHGLIFERFLNPDRVSMPDFDIDFDERRRGEVIQYVTEKYGDDRVSYIVTYGTIKAKQAVKDSSPDPRLPVRDGRPDHQGDAGRGDGQGRPAQGDLRPGPQALRRGRRVPLPVRRRRRRQARGRHRDRHRGPEAPVGRARRRRDHVQRAAARHHPDAQAARRRRDDHAVRLPDLREPRPDQDGLPGAAQPHGPRRRRQEHRGQPRRDGGPRGARAHRPGDVQAAPARRHPRRLPARRRPDARPAPLDAARHVRGHLRGRRPLPARPDGRRLPQQVRPPQDRTRAGRGDPPRAGGAAGRDPGRDLRPDRLPGAGHGDRPEGRGLQPRAGGHPAPGDGQEEEGGAGQAVRGLLRRHARARLLAWTPSRRCGTSCCRSPTTPSTRPTPRRTAWCRTGPPTSRPTTPPSTWPPC